MTACPALLLLLVLFVPRAHASLFSLSCTYMQWLWDFRSMVVRLHGAWRAAAWGEIRTEALVEENKELLKQLRRQGNEQQVGCVCSHMDRVNRTDPPVLSRAPTHLTARPPEQAIKAWRVYQRTEEELNTMATVLPLVDDLHSPAIRGR